MSHLQTHHITTLAQKWLRWNWPSLSPQDGGVAIVFVNYNTFDLTAWLLFSIFRVLGTDSLSRIVAIDNNSTDGSRELLERFAAAGMIDLIGNAKQNYHGPAINQAIAYLARQQRNGGRARKTRYIWILDSDVILLRSDAIGDAVHFLEKQEAAAIGQFQYDALPEGYAHISSLLIDPAKTWRRSIAPFDNTGAPAANFQRSLRAHGLKVCDFPYRAHHYLLHLARGTLKGISTRGEKNNVYYQWAKTHAEHHYHGDVGGETVHMDFLRIFEKEVATPSISEIFHACRKNELVTVPRYS